MEVNWLTSRESRGDCKEKKKDFQEDKWKTNARQIQKQNLSEKNCQSELCR